MKKPPLLVIIAVSFSFLYVASGILYYYAFCTSEFDAAMKKNEKALAAFSQISSEMAKAGHLKELQYALEEARSQKLIDFYIAQKGPQVVFFGNADSSPDAINSDYQRFNQILTYPHVIYATQKIDNLRITVGINRNRDKFLRLVAKEHVGMLLKDILLVLTLVLGVVFYSSRDLFALMSRLKSARLRRFTGISPLSREAQLLASSLGGYEEQVATLGKSNRALFKQLPSAFRSDLAAGLKPSAEFSCTLVRTDINHYSELLKRVSADEFGKTLRSFFLNADRAVSRYGGRVLKVLGDEIIYYFKDTAESRSAPLAIKAAQAIHSLADELHRDTQKKGYSFRVKSSLAHGKVKCVAVMDMLDLEGQVLIETKRLLDQIVDREVSSIVYSESLCAPLAGFCDSALQGTAELKGIPGPTRIFSPSRWHTLKEILKAPPPDRIALIDAFRSDADIREKLGILREEFESTDSRLFMQLVSSIKRCRLEECGLPLKADYENLLAHLATLSRRGSSENLDRGLSAVIMLASSLLGRHQYDESLDSLLLGLLVSRNDRVIANTLEMISYFNAEADELPLPQLLKHRNNRVRANAIIRAGKQDLDDKSLASLRGMLEQKDPLPLASGLYALGELAAYWKQEQPVFYSTQIALQKLIQSVGSHFHHPDEMVVRQALLVARKTGDPFLCDKIHSVLASKESDRLSPLIKRHFSAAA